MNPAILESLIAIGTPLFLAATTKKKKAAKKKIKLPAKKSRPAVALRKEHQASPKKKSRPAAAQRRAHQAAPKKNLHPPLKKPVRPDPKGKAPPPAPKKVEEEEPFVPPVAPFGRAILLVPKDGTYVDSFHPTFRWLSVGGATRYEVQWSEDATLASKYGTVSLATEATVPVEKPLRVGGLYYWRVRGGNDAGWGPWSLIGSFRVLEETPS